MGSSTSVYSEIELSTEVMSASKHRLIQLLLDKCLALIQVAKVAIQQNEVDLRNNHISRANDIVIYLRACLNHEEESAKELALLLDSNYIFVEKCLLNTMLKNEDHYLDLAATVITNIKSGWDEIGQSQQG